MSIHYVTLTHDVDWSRHGPPFEHVLVRLSRFPVMERWRFLALRENIYDGFNVIMDAEDRVNARSTILFRPLYDEGGTIDEYADILSMLEHEGFEIGLHSNNALSLDSLATEKAMVESACGCRVFSHRAHYLRIEPGIIGALGSRLGLVVDSSKCYTRHAPRVESPSFEVIGSTLELPITIMDTYIFSYWGVTDEEKVVKLVRDIVWKRILKGERVTTILWHVNAMRMYGGRVYAKMLEELYSLDGVIFARMIDVYKAWRSGELGGASPLRSESV